MPVSETNIEGAYVVRWHHIEDKRGFFKHSYQASEIESILGREIRLRQSNHSRSRAGVLRGFHTEGWDKFIYVVRGTALCVVADVRPNSTTFAKTESFLLGDPPGEYARLFISQGLSNAFYCQTETDYVNDVSEEFNPAKRAGLAWNDPTLAVKWPTDSPILSEADSSQPTLRQLFPDHPLILCSEFD